MSFLLFQRFLLNALEVTFFLLHVGLQVFLETLALRSVPTVMASPTNHGHYGLSPAQFEDLL